ncbi:hypothetical protein TWF694_009366 [Orbilia ellipsospora]|uniref:Serine carboxypeptidase n=1 Tax=Orbilia ellipsospora TaxID=2528407 RepID=A0AAV9XEN6_9PEZI
MKFLFKFTISLLASSQALALPTNDGTTEGLTKRDFVRSKLGPRVKDATSQGFDKVRQFFGYLDDDKKDKHMFYCKFELRVINASDGVTAKFPRLRISARKDRLFANAYCQFKGFYESRSKPQEDPIIIWFSGGPGESSVVEMFDIGPAVATKDGKHTSKPLSWNNFANLMFIDNPIGAGFSYGKAVNYTSDAAKDIVPLLERFFQDFPEYSKQPVHLTGSSYAGHWVPAFADEIVRTNAKVNLKSISIGNGIMNSKIQYPYWIETICSKDSPYPRAKEENCARMKAQLPDCMKQLKTCAADPKNDLVCRQASEACDSLMDAGNVYGWDIRNPPFDHIESEALDSLHCGQTWLGQDSTAKLFGAFGHDYSTAEASNKLTGTGDSVIPYDQGLPRLLKKGIEILRYAGDADYVCNWLGNKALAESIQWDGKAEFGKTPMKSFSVESVSKPVGETKSARGLLHFVRVFNAGHAVPIHQPQVAHDMMKAALSGKLK